MQERLPDVQNSGVYFFRGDFDWVLRGVVLEYVPRGVYIWDFVFPLFDLKGPNLLYSERVADGAFVGKEQMSEAELVDHVLGLPEAVNAFGAKEVMSISDFRQYLGQSNALLNAHGQLIQAAATILAGHPAEAASMLDGLGSKLHPSDIESWGRLRAALATGPEAAIGLLEQRRVENLHAFEQGDC
jgi:hypothetical protein